MHEKDEAEPFPTLTAVPVQLPAEDLAPSRRRPSASASGGNGHV